jgi:hypothetical protein
MKYLLILLISLSCAVSLQAQTGKKATPKTSKRVQRGAGQYHGSRDTTPGSPMGTGGSGGDDMSGSPAGSAIETKDQTEAAKVKKGNSGGKKAAGNKGANHKRRSMIRKRV